MNIDVNASALTAFGNGMNVIAHNIANMNTPEFKASSASYTSGPSDQGVQFVHQAPSENINYEYRQVNTSYESRPPAVGDMPMDVALNMGYINNNVDVSREMVNMMITQRGFEANAVSIRTVEDMSGLVVDIVS